MAIKKGTAKVLEDFNNRILNYYGVQASNIKGHEAHTLIINEDENDDGNSSTLALFCLQTCKEHITSLTQTGRKP